VCALTASRTEETDGEAAGRPEDGPVQAAAGLGPRPELLMLGGRGREGAAGGGARLGGRRHLHRLQRRVEAGVGGLEAGLHHLQRTGDDGARCSAHPDEGRRNKTVI